MKKVKSTLSVGKRIVLLSLCMTMLSVAGFSQGAKGKKVKGQGAGKYFNFKSHETAHFFEAGLAYTLPCEKLPLSMAWYLMFAGADKNEEGKQNYSSYCELNYPFSVKSVDLNATVGFVPYKTYTVGYGNSGFAFTNVALKATTAIRITDSFSLPIFAQAIWNPCLEDAHLVFGITLKP